MIIITRAKLRFLRADRTLTIPDTTGRYKPGHEYNLATQPGKPPICRVQILETTPDTITIQLAVQPGRYLARNPGMQRSDYVDHPSAGAPGEPQAVDEEYVDRITREARAKRALELADFASQVVKQAETLAVDANRQQRSQLRNLKRAAGSLNTRT